MSYAEIEALQYQVIDLQKKLKTSQAWHRKTHKMAVAVMEVLVGALTGDKLKIEYNVIPGYYDENGDWVDLDDHYGCRAILKVLDEKIISYSEVGGIKEPWKDEEMEKRIRDGFLIGIARLIWERLERQRILLRRFGKIT